ncbi:hypothetical protein JKP88DRAFT_280724 [Tribonema minus]|uniref:SH3 domain-containing protein n=1 Tax=Tribonema minus TaxID=303371 RepID=A0A835YP67_9STRA|nr:hypothetical protein JKP88DRAFT_280724 [Tribonema minus]
MTGRWATAQWDYSPGQEDELELKQGDRVKLIARSEDNDGWWLARNELDNTGLVPDNYLSNAAEEDDNDDNAQQRQQQRQRRRRRGQREQEGEGEEDKPQEQQEQQQRRRQQQGEEGEDGQQQRRRQRKPAARTSAESAQQSADAEGAVGGEGGDDGEGEGEGDGDALPVGWFTAQDPASGATYYFTEGGLSTWVKPHEAAPGMEEEDEAAEQGGVRLHEAAPGMQGEPKEDEAAPGTEEEDEAAPGMDVEPEEDEEEDAPQHDSGHAVKAAQMIQPLPHAAAAAPAAATAAAAAAVAAAAAAAAHRSARADTDGTGRSARADTDGTGGSAAEASADREDQESDDGENGPANVLRDNAPQGGGGRPGTSARGSPRPPHTPQAAAAAAAAKAHGDASNSPLPARPRASAEAAQQQQQQRTRSPRRSPRGSGGGGAAAAGERTATAVDVGATAEFIARLVDDRLKDQLRARDALLEELRAEIAQLRAVAAAASSSTAAAAGTAAAPAPGSAFPASAPVALASPPAAAAPSKAARSPRTSPRGATAAAATQRLPRIDSTEATNGGSARDLAAAAAAAPAAAAELHLPRVANAEGVEAALRESRAARHAEQRSAVRYPWCRTAVYPPSAYDDTTFPRDTSPPDSSLSLEYVHGYSGDGRGGGAARATGTNVLWLKSGELVFPASAVVVIHDFTSNRQPFLMPGGGRKVTAISACALVSARFLLSGCSGEVTAIAVHAPSALVASAQCQHDAAYAFVYDAAAGSGGGGGGGGSGNGGAPDTDGAAAPIAELLAGSGTAVKGIAGLDFSPCGRLLLALVLAECQMLHIWDWRRGTQLIDAARACPGRLPVACVRFHPHLWASPSGGPNGGSSGGPNWGSGGGGNWGPPGEARFCLISAGERHVRFWTLERRAREAPSTDVKFLSADVKSHAVSSRIGKGGRARKEQGGKAGQRARVQHIEAAAERKETVLAVAAIGGVASDSRAAPKLISSLPKRAQKRQPPSPTARAEWHLDGGAGRFGSGAKTVTCVAFVRLRPQQQQQQGAAAATVVVRALTGTDGGESSTAAAAAAAAAAATAAAAAVLLWEQLSATAAAAAASAPPDGPVSPPLSPAASDAGSNGFGSGAVHFQTAALSNVSPSRHAKAAARGGWLAQGRVTHCVSGAHAGAVTDLCVLQPDDAAAAAALSTGAATLATAGADGTLKLWKLVCDVVKLDLVLEPLLAIEVAARGVALGHPRSLSWDDSGTTIAVGTAGNAICLVQPPTDMAGNSCDPADMAGVSDSDRGAQRDAHASNASSSASLGGGGARSGDVMFMLALGGHTAKLPDQGCSLAFHPSGNVLAVGTRTGDLIVLGLQAGDDAKRVAWEPIARKRVIAPTSTSISTAAASRLSVGEGVRPQETAWASEITALRFSADGGAITALRFSADGGAVAAGCRDACVYLFAVAAEGRKYRRAGVCRGHTSEICSVDFSSDGHWLQSSDASKELLYWHGPHASKLRDEAVWYMGPNAVSHAFELRDEEWSTWTSTLGWPVRGAAAAAAGEVISVARTHSGGTALVSVGARGGGGGGSGGGLCLLRLPCHEGAAAAAAAAAAHAGGAAAAVAFLADDRRAVSAGGDGCVLQWRHHRGGGGGGSGGGGSNVDAGRGG